MNKNILLSLFLSFTACISATSLNFELKDIDTARVYGFHPECNGANNAGVWECENLVLLTEDIYPGDVSYSTMQVIVSYYEALFASYSDITSAPELPITPYFGTYNNKPTYHITTNMCPGYAGGAFHGALGNVTARGYFDFITDRIEHGDTSFNQVYTYEMHRNFWWGDTEWDQKIGWKLDHIEPINSRWALIFNVANGMILTRELGVGIFEDPPYNDWASFYVRNTETFDYYRKNRQYNFENTLAYELLDFDWLPEVRGFNNLLNGMVIYSYDNFGGYDWLKGFYTWLASDEIKADYRYTDVKNPMDNCYKIWCMAADSALLNFFESELGWDVSQKAIDWVAKKLDVKVNAPTKLMSYPLNDSIYLQWNDNANNEEGYIIERSALGGTSFQEVARVNANVNAYIDGIKGNFAYRVLAYKQTDASDYSNADTVDFSLPLADIPLNVRTESTSSESVTLHWKTPKVGSVSAAEITFVNDDNGLSYVKVLNNNDTSYCMKNLDPTSVYSCKVRFYNNNGYGAYSEIVSASTKDVSPIAPNLTRAGVLSSSSIKIKWGDNSKNEDGFLIRRKVEGEFYRIIDTVPANERFYTDVNLASGTTYFYKVKAFNVAGTSPSSNEMSATTEIGSSVEERTATDLCVTYPNPVESVLNIDFKGIVEEKEIKIFSMNGGEIYSISTSASSCKVDAFAWNSGIYFLEVSYSSGSKYTSKLVIK